MRLLFSRCHGENPLSCGAPEFPELLSCELELCFITDLGASTSRGFLRHVLLRWAFHERAERKLRPTALWLQRIQLLQLLRTSGAIHRSLRATAQRSAANSSAAPRLISGQTIVETIWRANRRRIQTAVSKTRTAPGGVVCVCGTGNGNWLKREPSEPAPPSVSNSWCGVCLTNHATFFRREPISFRV